MDEKSRVYEYKTRDGNKYLVMQEKGHLFLLKTGNYLGPVDCVKEENVSYIGDYILEE